ncbi:MAG: hypothetical protein Ct9H90mP22_2950 [Gammaproteobacteria bacterium]|nr:MAG: hypothetical protein Ct9H90mP22_2950 [Gammaproteobacteria bacterium]
MMACIADKIIASPFALIGSIGVMELFQISINCLRKIILNMKCIQQVNIKEQ